MEEIIFPPDDYHTILLTNDIRDKNMCRDIEKCCENDEEIEPILVVPSRIYEGFPIIDGNHRAITIGSLERNIRGYIIHSDFDGEMIEQLQNESVLRPGSAFLEEFIKGSLSLKEFIQMSEEAHEEEMCKLSLADYLDANYE